MHTNMELERQMKPFIKDLGIQVAAVVTLFAVVIFGLYLLTGFLPSSN